MNASQHKVITIDLSKDEPEIRDFIPEVKDAKLVQINCVNKEYFVVIYKRNVIPLGIWKISNVHMDIRRSKTKYISTPGRAFSSLVWQWTLLASHL